MKMESKVYKKVFKEVAKLYGFESVYGSFFKESADCIVVLDLQKSGYAPVYRLMIKAFVHHLFDSSYPKSKELVRQNGNIFRRPPNEYEEAFDLEHTDDTTVLYGKLSNVFENFITPYVNSVLDLKIMVENIKEDKHLFLLLPEVRRRLSILVGEEL